MKLKQEQQREYLFDNYKVLLIILVVIGHFIEPCYDQNSFLYELKWGIVAFHMPAFIFISGYFSKRIPSIKKLIQGLVIPYFVYELVYYFLYTLVLDKHTGLYFDRPKVLTLVSDGVICMAFAGAGNQESSISYAASVCGRTFDWFCGTRQLSVHTKDSFFSFRFLWRGWNLTAVCWNDSESRQDTVGRWLFLQC